MSLAGAQLLDSRWRSEPWRGGGGVPREPEGPGPGVVDAVVEGAEYIAEVLDDDAVVELERRVDGVSIGGGEGE